MHIAKKGLRALGVAESFSGRVQSILAGVVMRKDLRIDGMAFARITVGGMDATAGVLQLYRELDRKDINCILIHGCIISWYNIIDPEHIHAATGLPVIVVTYEDSDGLEEDIVRYFPGDVQRLSAYQKLETRRRVRLGTGYEVFLRSLGIPLEDAAKLCSLFTFDGRIPEPLRTARLAARAVLHSGFFSPT